MVVPDKGEFYQIIFCKEDDAFTRYKTIEQIEAYLNYMPETVEDMEYLLKNKWNAGHQMEI